MNLTETRAYMQALADMVETIDQALANRIMIARNKANPHLLSWRILVQQAIRDNARTDQNAYDIATIYRTLEGDRSEKAAQTFDRAEHNEPCETTIPDAVHYIQASAYKECETWALLEAGQEPELSPRVALPVDRVSQDAHHKMHDALLVLRDCKGGLAWKTFTPIPTA